MEEKINASQDGGWLLLIEDFKGIVYAEYRKSCKAWWSKHRHDLPNAIGRQFVYNKFVQQFDHQWVELHIDEIIGTLDQIDAAVLVEIVAARR